MITNQLPTGRLDCSMPTPEEAQPLLTFPIWRRWSFPIWRKFRNLCAHHEMYVAFVLWFISLVIGTVFYTHVLDLSYSKGFYMATYILYNVGYGDIDESDVYASMWFSSLYMLLGVSFVGWAQGLFAANILMAKEKWYENIILKKQFKEEMQRTPYNFIFIFLKS